MDRENIDSARLHRLAVTFLAEQLVKYHNLRAGRVDDYLPYFGIALEGNSGKLHQGQLGAIVGGYAPIENWSPDRTLDVDTVANWIDALGVDALVGPDRPLLVTRYERKDNVTCLTVGQSWTNTGLAVEEAKKRGEHVIYSLTHRAYREIDCS